MYYIINKNILGDQQPLFDLIEKSADIHVKLTDLVISHGFSHYIKDPVMVSGCKSAVMVALEKGLQAPSKKDWSYAGQQIGGYRAYWPKNSSIIHEMRKIGGVSVDDLRNLLGIPENEALPYIVISEDKQSLGLMFNAFATPQAIKDSMEMLEVKGSEFLKRFYNGI